MDLEVRLLGPLEIEVAGEMRAIGGLRACRLLTLLLLNENSVVSTDRLVEVLWEEAPQSARQQIHNTVTALRRTISTVPGIDIVTAQIGYRVDVDSDCLDLTRFRSAVQKANEAVSAGDSEAAISQLKVACGLWRGAPLAGLEGQYFVNVATRLEEEHLSATEALMALQVKVGDAGHAVGQLMELVAAHPLRESPRASLMAALHGTGRQADALEVYEEGRRLLVEEFGLDPSADLQALHDRILQGLPVFDSSAAERFPAPPDPAPILAAATQLPTQDLNHRRFLPHDPREFSGRGLELLQLVEDSRHSESVSLVISAINGMGGIGKTALAVRFAHTVADDYPDGQYFVDLRGFAVGVEPLTAADALGVLLRQCGRPDELIPPDLEGRVSSWRGEMAGKRALVLLDNAVGVQQVRPLLPGAKGPLVLITSRRRLSMLEGAVPLPLDLMPLDDAVALFIRVVGARRLSSHEDQLTGVVELCGRLPLAIRIAAARFRDRTSWTLEYLVQCLSDQEQRARLLDFGERSVTAVLGLSYRCLSGDHSRLFRLLSLHPGPDFDVPVAAALAALPLDRAHDVLESLLDDNLILQDEPGRYHFHDLVRDYATRLCSEHDSKEEREDAYDRMFDYHLQCAVTWGQPLAKGPFRFSPDIVHAAAGVQVPTSAAQAIELLTQESRNLVEVSRAAFGRRLPGRAWQLVCALQPFFRRTNYTGAALELFENAIEAAQSAKDEHGEALCLMGQAGALRERGRTSDAHAALEAAVAISRRRGDRSAEMYQLTELGVLKVSDESFMEAYNCFRSALTLVATMSDPELGAALKNNLGVVCRELGRSAEGFDYLSQALAFRRATEGGLSEAYPLVNIGILLARQGRFSEATECLNRALQIANEGDHIYVKSATQATLCTVSRALGDLPRAFEFGRAALGLAREHRLLEIECDALNGLGEAYLAARDLTNAEVTFQHAADLSRDRMLRSYEARALEGFAHIALYRGDEREALRGFRLALSAYPPDAADAENSRIHCAGTASPDVRCLRCRADSKFQ